MLHLRQVSLFHCMLVSIIYLFARLWRAKVTISCEKNHGRILIVKLCKKSGTGNRAGVES